MHIVVSLILRLISMSFCLTYQIVTVTQAGILHIVRHSSPEIQSLINPFCLTLLLFLCLLIIFLWLIFILYLGFSTSPIFVLPSCTDRHFLASMRNPSNHVLIFPVPSPPSDVVFTPPSSHPFCASAALTNFFTPSVPATASCLSTRGPLWYFGVFSAQ